ncbi:MAG: MlaD family protein [Candidatus Omnitrophica bacterium]|nr:MlaD family protein [Candidatus Omnitrophota bacterium]
MIFGKTKLELKVGMFVFIGLIIFTVFILSIGGFKTWSSGYRVNFVFGFVDGVKHGAPVRFAGVDSGTVKLIKFFYDPKDAKIKVRITCWVGKDVKIPVDSRIWVNTLGLLGEKYIEIMPGKDYAKFLQEDEEIIGEDPIPLNLMMKSVLNIVDNLDVAIAKIVNKEGTIGKLLYDDSIYNQLDALVTDVRKNPWKLLVKTKEKK